ncbi:MAG: glycine--tRNA ligase subunit beta [Betaproteobacteria bacterium]|jgi:glycyl-tRNA synthetase beta chain
MSQSAPLLVELFTEELPPKSLKRLGGSFSSQIIKKLASLGLCAEHVEFRSFASPRRLAVLINDVLDKAPDLLVKEKLLPVSIALLENGQASPPLLKKLSSLGVADAQISSLERIGEGKNEAFYIHLNKKGLILAQGLQEAIDFSISQLPIAKTMHYQIDPGTSKEIDVQFVRPAHRLIALHGSDIVPVCALGLQSGRTTMGHRFLSTGAIEISDASSYELTLKSAGKVIAHYQDRLDSIREGLLAKAEQCAVLMPDALLEEVTSLVEWPTIYACEFEKEFLDVPQECLILTMQTNQKYFALTDPSGKLVHRFLIVSNIQTNTPESIISGNERVVRPRLSDAKFFYQQDRKQALINRFEQLSKVVYHNKLGNQKERITRIAQIAKYLSGQLSLHFSDSQATSLQYADLSERAAMLMKADLLTDMVGEFPELQGIMGRYYAIHDGEHVEVAAACAEHYLPRFAGDQLPTTRVGLTLALSDKLETVVGIWGIGLAPTGEKDPYALRRHALGICRLIIENNLPINLSDLLSFTKAQFSSVEVQTNAVVPDILQFIKDRLKSYAKESQGIIFTTEEIEAVLANIDGQFNEVPKKLLAVHAFQKLPEASILANANKRLNNILKKNASENISQINSQLFDLPAEKKLFATMQELEPVLKKAFVEQDFQLSLELLTKVSGPIEAFFADVMVMDPDQSKRQNRLALLDQLYKQMNQVADISQLAQ